MAKKNERDADREQAAEPASEQPIVALGFIEINKQGQLVSKTEYLHQIAESGAPPQKLSGKAWVPIAFERRCDELRAMNISDASRVLAEESETAPDCKPLKPRYIEKLLRGLDIWPKACRNSSKQRPK